MGTKYFQEETFFCNSKRVNSNCSTIPKPLSGKDWVSKSSHHKENFRLLSVTRFGLLHISWKHAEHTEKLFVGENTSRHCTAAKLCRLSDGGSIHEFSANASVGLPLWNCAHTLQGDGLYLLRSRFSDASLQIAKGLTICHTALPTNSIKINHSQCSP